MHPAFAQTDHRPWPHPPPPHRWRQSWHDLLFAHWPIDADALRPLVHPSLEIDTYDGQTYIGVVPFRMTDIVPRGVPALPWVSAFLELNLRIYVVHEDRPGVWFLSLDAANPLAVWAARTFFHLPYHWACMSLERHGDIYTYASQRRRGSAPATFRGTYGPTGPVALAAPGTLDHWLTERYCLYTTGRGGRLMTADIHHVPWPLQPAQATFDENRLLEPHGLSVSGPPPLLHFSQRIDVAVWNLRRAAPPSASGSDRPASTAEASS